MFDCISFVTRAGLVIPSLTVFVEIESVEEALGELVSVERV